MQTRSLSLLLSLTVILLTATHLDAKQQVVVLVGAKAPALEKFAASQLQQQFQRLFDADVDVTSKLPRDHRTRSAPGHTRRPSGAAAYRHRKAG